MFDRTLYRTPTLRRASQGTALQSPDTVRVLRIDPQGVTLQLRMAKSYAQVWLPFAEAKQLAAWLMVASNATLQADD